MVAPDQRRIGIGPAQGANRDFGALHASESFNSTLEFELLSRRRFATKAEARREVARFIDRYNRVRRHSTCEMHSPVDYEAIFAHQAEAEADAA